MGRISKGRALRGLLVCQGEDNMVSKGSTTASLAVLLALVPSLALAQTPASGKPLRLAQLAPPPLPQSAAQFFYNDNGKPVGPVTLAEIQAKIAAGVIKPETLVWKAGAPNWVA